MKVLKLTLLIILFGVFYGFNTEQLSDTKFTDEYGNNFTIPTSELIPNPLTNEFLIANLNGTYFKSQPYIPDLQFDYFISELKKVNRNNFKFRIQQNPRTGDIRTKLGFFGAKYYNIKIKRKKNGIELIEIKYLYAVH